MKTLKFFNYILLVLATLMAITAVFAFINGNITSGICNIMWMGCEVIFFSMNKKFIQIKQDNANVDAFLLDINNTIGTYGAAIITKDDDGTWSITRGIAVEHNNPSCSAENNDQIEFTHISDNDQC